MSYLKPAKRRVSLHKFTNKVSSAKFWGIFAASTIVTTGALSAAVVCSIAYLNRSKEHYNLNRVYVKGNKNIVVIDSDSKAPAAAQWEEGRRSTIQNHAPTGLYVKKGQTIKVNVHEINENSKPRLWVESASPKSSASNTTEDRSMSNLHEGLNTFTASTSGVIFVTLDGLNGKAKFEIENTNLEKVTTWQKGENQWDFINKISMDKPNFVNLVTDYTVQTVSLSVFKKAFMDSKGLFKKGVSLKEFAEQQDAMINFYNHQIGINFNGTGATKRFKHKINFFWKPSAQKITTNEFSDGFIYLGEKLFSAKLTGATKNLIAHKLGHVYTNSTMQWNDADFKETIADYWSDMWREKSGTDNYVNHSFGSSKTDKETIDKVKSNWKAGGVSDFNKEWKSVKALMLLQLNKTFG